MVGESAEGKGLLLGKVPFRLGAVEGEQGHHLVVIGEVQGHGVADIIGGVEVPVDQGVLPVRRALAALDHQGLWCVAHPQALVLVVPLDPKLLQLAKGFRQAEGVPVEDLPGVGSNLHLHQTGIGAGDQQLHLGQDGALQVVHVLTGVDVVDNFVIKQKKILVHGPPPFRQTRLRQRTCVPFYCPPPAKSRASPSFFLPTKGKLPTIFLPLPTLSCWIREGTTEESSHFSPGLAIVPGGLSGYHTDRTKPRPPAPAGSASPSQKGGPPP